jgi:hypothetical protein
MNQALSLCLLEMPDNSEVILVQLHELFNFLTVNKTLYSDLFPLSINDFGNLHMPYIADRDQIFVADVHGYVIEEFLDVFKEILA